MEHYDFRRVSITALVPAFARGQLTDIPFAEAMLAFLQNNGVSMSESVWSERAIHQYAAFFESRFKAVNRILEERGATQVLELAAGLSPRGMDFAQRGVKYVEMDLDDSIAQKRDIVTTILGSIPPKLILCPASVLDRAEFVRCCAVFGSGPVFVTTEGLLRYLTFDEKTKLAANVHDLLSRNGGMWITTDIHLRSWAQQRAPIRREQETERLGRDLAPNYFESSEHAREFFEGCGFRVEPQPLLEGIRDRVISLPDAPPDLLAELNDRQLFILHVRELH